MSPRRRRVAERDPEATVAEVFHAFANPTRQAIVEALVTKPELRVRELVRVTGASQPAVSQHLTVLVAAALLRWRSAGKKTYYALDRAALRDALVWLERLAQR